MTHVPAAAGRNIKSVLRAIQAKQLRLDLEPRPGRTAAERRAVEVAGVIEDQAVLRATTFTSLAEAVQFSGRTALNEYTKRRDLIPGAPESPVGA